MVVYALGPDALERWAGGCAQQGDVCFQPFAFPESYALG
jgi:hypothetical protein